MKIHELNILIINIWYAFLKTPLSLNPFRLDLLTFSMDKNCQAVKTNIEKKHFVHFVVGYRMLDTYLLRTQG